MVDLHASNRSIIKEITFNKLNIVVKEKKSHYKLFK